MPLSQSKVDETLASANVTVKSYDQVENAAASAQETYTNVKQTQVGLNTNDVVGGIKSLTGDATVAGTTSTFNPTEGQVTAEAIPGAVNNALDTDITTLSSKFGTTITTTFSDSGRVIGVDSASSTSGTLSSFLTQITGLAQSPGYLQNLISSSNAKGLDVSIGGLTGRVGAFSNVAAVNGISSRTQSIVSDLVSTAVTNGDSKSLGALNKFQNEASNAIADVSNMITGGTTVSVPNVIAAVTGVRDPNLLPQVRSYKNTRAGVVNKSNQFQSDLSKLVPSNNQLGFIQNLVQQVEPRSLRNILVRNNIELTPDEIAEVAYLTQGTPEQRTQAESFVQKKSGRTNQEVKAFLSDLDTTIAGTVVVDTRNATFSDPFQIGGTDGSWDNGVGSQDFTFTFISSTEELEAELKSVSRPITEVVVHWTETYTNTNIGSEEINENHNSLGLNGIGYHYVIRRDGSLQRGRPSGQEGEHADNNNHNKYSLAIVFVGGLNCPSGTPNALEYRSASSLTRSQYTTFNEFCKAFYMAYPGGQIIGHNDVNSNEDDPGFDVRDYCQDIFGKVSKFTDPQNQQPFTPDEINS